MTVTSEQKQLLQSTVYVLKEHGRAVMTSFYASLFKNHPEYRNFFNPTNQATGKQPEAFAATIVAFVDNLDNSDALVPQMSRLSSKHRAVGVRPENYPTVGKYLIQAITDALGDKNTPEVAAAWQALYNAMASVFIKKEKELYEQLGNNPADKGFVPFTVLKKEVVASGPTYVVTLARQDGGKLWKYQPGQYVTLRVEIDGIANNGHYSLLEPYNGSTYKVALKQGNKNDQNTVTTEEVINNRPLNSTVLVSAPAGGFSLVNDAKSSLFISGGIGIASLLAQILALNQQGKASSVTLIQCVRNEDYAAFAAKLHNILPAGQYIILTEQDPISKKHLQGKVQPDTQVYASGSEMFLDLVQSALVGANVPASQVHIKSIEPTLGLLKNIGK
jgi:nitric oxide dioxygenase